MAGEFTVKILSSEDFDKLPFKRIMNNPSAVLGAADKKNRVAYVRDTGYNDITKANIGHELDELMADTSEHEEDGIRYKDFSQSFGNFLGKAPVIGKATGALGRFAGSGIDALGRGASNIGLPNFNVGNPSASQLPGFGTGSGSTFGPQTQFQSAFSSGVNKANAAAGPANFRDAVAKGAQGASAASAARGSFPGFNPAGSVSSTPSGGGIGEFISNLFQGGGGDGDGDGEDSTFASQIGDVLPGAAVSLLGNLFADKVEAPDFTGIRDELASKTGSGGSPAFDLGFGEAKKQLAGNPGDIPPNILAEIDLRRDEEIRALENRFRAAGQGGGISESDTSRMGILRAEIVRKFEAEKETLGLNMNAQRIQVMSEVLGLDQSQFNQYAKLAEFDIATLITQYGLDVQTATQFKELFGNIGGQLISSATGGGNGTTINIGGTS